MSRQNNGNPAAKNNPLELVAYAQPRTAVAEAYRTLRTNLGFASPDSACRLIMVTSAGPGEGKTTTVCNLAVVLAQAGHRVLLVDCDLRKPQVHRVFGLANQFGFTNLILGVAGLDKAIQKGPVEGLEIITSGPLPPNPAELLHSEKGRSLWPSLREGFDYILVDSPPVLLVTDPTVLSSSMDGVILVVQAGNTRIDIVREALDQLGRASARIIGTVLNRVRVDKGNYYYYHYRVDAGDGVKL